MEKTAKRGLSAAVLKNIAVITMTIDHITAFILKEFLNFIGADSSLYSQLYYTGRVIGRIAFVLYAFMIAEGARRTKNKRKYALRLLFLAVISIVPHSYVNSGKWFYPQDMNIFFLLFTGLITIYLYEWIADHAPGKAARIILQTAVIAATSLASIYLHFEYGMMGILLIMVFYIFRFDFPKMAVYGALVMSAGYMAHYILGHHPVTWFSSHSSDLVSSLLRIDRIQIWGLLAFPLIFLYNGEKGKQLPKAFYYFYYPVHLGILGLIAHTCF